MSFSFGTTPAAAPMNPAAQQQPPAFSFGLAKTTPSTLPTLNFGGPPASMSATSLAPTSSAPAFTPSLQPAGGTTNFSFGNKPAASTNPAGLNFGAITTSTGSFAPGGGLFGKPVTTAATAPTPFVGLGGIDISSTQPKAGDSKQDNIKVKETQVPDEIAKTVDSLKSFIKTQKTMSSEIGRTSTSKLTNVSNEIMNMQWLLQEISNSVESNYNQIKLLRKETTKAIQSAEMAQRTQDTPAGLQFENTTPFQYFQKLVEKYEQDLINFQQQIATTEQHMQSLTNPQTVTPEDLKRGFKQINESFISLAGRLHEIHQQVEGQKEQYLNLRKYRLHDATNVFSEIDNPEVKVDATDVGPGPTPFSVITAMSSFGKSFANSSAGGSGATNAQTK